MKVNIKELPTSNVRLEKNGDSGSTAFLYKKTGEQTIDSETTIVAEMFEISFPYYSESLKKEIVDNFDTYWQKGKEKEYSKIQRQMTDFVQNYLDREAQKKGYDGIASACTYQNSTNSKFKEEGQAYVAWRDSVWSDCYKILDDILEGKREIPSENELISELPKIEI